MEEVEDQQPTSTTPVAISSNRSVVMESLLIHMARPKKKDSRLQGEQQRLEANGPGATEVV